MADNDNRGIRIARNLSAGAVAAIAAWSSYSHMAHVALACGERPDVAYALPFSVDGMLIVATIVMVDDKRRAGRVRPTARLAFAAGVLASLAANIAAADPSIGARTVNAWPALALLLVVEMLARPPAPQAEVPPEPADLPPQRYDRRLQEADPAQVPPQAQVPPHGEVPPSREVPADGQVPPRAEVPLAGPPAPVTDRRVAGSAIVPAERPRSRGAAAAADRNNLPAGSARPSTNPDRSCVRRPTTVTRQLAHQIIDAEPDLPRAVIATRLGVSPRRLRAILAAPA